MRYILTLITAVVFSSALSVPANAQVSVTFNLDRQPIWGPTGYDHVEYYYLPDIGVYYYVPQHRYFYLEKERWVSGSSLPSRYRSFNLYNSYKVVINESTPYHNDKTYREKYASFKGRHDQESIRDSRDPKYYVNPKHPEHKNWLKQNKHGNNKGNDHGEKSGRK